MLLQCGTTQKYEPCQIVSADVKFQLLIIHWGRKKNSCVSKRQTFEAISRQHEVMNISELEHQFKSLTTRGLGFTDHEIPKKERSWGAYRAEMLRLLVVVVHGGSAPRLRRLLLSRLL